MLTMRLRDRAMILGFIVGAIIVGTLLAKLEARVRLGNLGWSKPANEKLAERDDMLRVTEDIAVVDFPVPKEKSIIAVQLRSNFTPFNRSPCRSEEHTSE